VISLQSRDISQLTAANDVSNENGMTQQLSIKYKISSASASS